MDDERAAVVVEQGRAAAAEGHAIGRGVEVADALGVDLEVRQVPAMRAVRVVEAVLARERVVVAARGGEGRVQEPTAWMWMPCRPARGRRRARSRGPVPRRPRRASPTDWRAARVDERDARVRRGLAGGHDRRRGRMSNPAIAGTQRRMASSFVSI
jgi:hypothetical protein